MSLSRKKNELLSLLALLVLISLVGYMAAAITSLHLHVLPDGRIFVHSHATENTSDSNRGHSHSDKDYQFINHYSSLFKKSTTAVVLIIIIFFILIYNVIVFTTRETCRLSRVSTLTRAPPELSF